MVVILTLAPTASAPALKQRSAPAHDAVNAYRVLVPEGLAGGVDGLEREGGGVEGVDALMGRGPGVSAPANELNVLDHVAVAGAAQGQLAFSHIAGGVAHHGDVHVVKLAQPDQFLLAAH